MNKKNLNEYELLYLVRCDDEEAFNLLFESFRPMFLNLYKHIHKPYDTFTIDEAMQLAYIGLYNATYYYREDRNMAFHNFVRLCAEREMLAFMRKEMDHIMYDSKIVVSLDSTLGEDSTPYHTSVPAKDNVGNDPAKSSKTKEIIHQLFRIYNPRITNEGKILYYRMIGYSYKEIANALGLTTKQVDNLIQKIKKNNPSLFD